MTQTFYRCYFIDNNKQIELKSSHNFSDNAKADLVALSLEYIQINYGNKFSVEANAIFQDNISKTTIQHSHEEYPKGYYIFRDNENTISIYKKDINVVNVGWVLNSYQPIISFEYIGEFSFTADKIDPHKEYDIPAIQNKQNNYNNCDDRVDNINNSNDSNISNVNILNELQNFVKFRDSNKGTLKDTIKAFNN
jgi:hypothetical protein